MSSFILAGSGSRYLAEGIARVSGLDILENRVVRFANSEMKITLPKGVSKFDKCYLVQTASNPTNDSLIEILFTSDTLKLEGVKNIEVIIPYFGYSRQDKQHLPRECVSAEIMAKLLKSVGVQKVYTADIHNEKVLENLAIPVLNYSVIPEIAVQVYNDLNLNTELESNFTIASPDQGGIGRANLFTKHFYRQQSNQEVVSIKKERELDKQHISKAVELYGEIKDKNVIIVDDVSTSGNTLLNALELCEINGVSNVYAVVIHSDFAREVPEKITHSNLKKIYTTNTIEKTLDNLGYYRKIKILDVSRVFKLDKD
jgi:ribose-phosphate pyrophosphokinase